MSPDAVGRAHGPGSPHLALPPTHRGVRRDVRASLPVARVEHDLRAATTAERALAESTDGASALLLLLAREAPAGELSRLPALCDSPGLASAVASALEVRALLDGRQRREQQLAALYASASDLSSLHDLEQVLQAIVRRARGLLDSDAAYLTLSDATRGATYMRVTEGIRTQAFKEVLIPFGAGLGGLVAETVTPYSTADYAADARFEHVIDDTVAGEGLVAILGVPLRLGDKAIGVLYAANRRERPFSNDEVALLLSLADHAAVAIETASLFEELKTALADLQRASDVISAHSNAVERAAAEHERLSAVLLNGGGLVEVATAVVDVLGGSLLVVDPAGRLLVSAGPDVADAAAVADAALPRSRGRRARTSRTPAGEPVVVAPVFAGGDVLGAVVSVGRDLDDAEVRILERATVVTALLLLQERSIGEAEHRLRGELFDDLFAVPQRDLEGLHRRALHLGLDLATPYVVAVVRLPDPTRTTVAWRAARTAHGPAGTSGEHRGDLVLLVAAADAAAAGRRIAAQIGDAVGTPVTVGVAGPGAGAQELGELYREASRCCDVLVSLGRAGEVAGRDELGVYGLLLSAAGQTELDRFVTRTVGALLEYDRERGSELVRTLLAFYGAGGSLTRTAQELFVHVNTLYQRLERITQLLGDRWRSGDGALQVHLALQLHSSRRG
ncbi:MAG: hypothetical protein JWN08_2194 [Frankiales bacterium]|nr:hypothetical protein [Frankiales bacterium]